MQKTFQQMSEAVPSKELPSDFLQICSSTSSHASPTNHPKSSYMEKLPTLTAAQPTLVSSPYQLDSHLLHSAMANSASRQIQEFFSNSNSRLLSSAEESSVHDCEKQSDAHAINHSNSPAVSEANEGTVRGSLNINEIISVPIVNEILNHQNISRSLVVQPQNVLVHQVLKGKTDVAMVLKQVDNTSVKFSEEKNATADSQQNCVSLDQSDAQHHFVLASDYMHHNSGSHPVVYLPQNQNQASSKLYAFAKMVDSHLNATGQDTYENLNQEFNGKRANILSSDTRLYSYQTGSKGKDNDRSSEKENTSNEEEIINLNGTDYMKNANSSESGSQSAKNSFPLVELRVHTPVDMNNMAMEFGIGNQDEIGCGRKQNKSDESLEKICPCINVHPGHNEAHYKFDSNSFICGSCCRSFQSICFLHAHLNVHSLGGSYYYDHVSQTAFPKFDTVCSETQTEFDFQKIGDKSSKTGSDRDKLELMGKGASANTTKTTFVASKDLNIHQSALPDMTVANEKRTTFSRHSRKQDTQMIKQNVKPNAMITEIKRRKQDSAMLNERLTDDKSVDMQKMNLNQHEKSEVADIDQDISMCTTDSVDDLNEGNRYGMTNEMIDMSDNSQTSERLENNLTNSQETTMVDDSTVRSLLVKGMGSDKRPCEKRKKSPKRDQQFQDSGHAGKSPMRMRKHAKVKSTPEKCLPHDSNFSQFEEDSDDKNRDIYKGNGKEISEFSETIENMEGKKVTKIKKAKEKKAEHGGKKDRYEVCSECGLPVLRSQFVFHTRQHTGERPFVCEKCGKSFARCRFLNKHLITHEEEKPWKCELCPAQFCQKNEYNMHVAGHVDDRPHKCNVCEMRFLSKTSLHTHQANIHMGLTRFECDVCKRRFYKRSSLNVHMATHFEPTLKCNFCDKKFRDKTGRKRHERIHTGIKMFKCHICDHSFIQSTPYWIHMEKHHSMSRNKIKEMLKTVKEQNRRAGIKVETITLPPAQGLSVNKVENTNQPVQNLPVQKSAVSSAASKPPVSQSSQLIIKIPSPKDKKQQKGQGHGQQTANVIPDNVHRSLTAVQKPFTQIKAPSRRCELMSFASESHGVVDIAVADMFSTNHPSLNSQNDDITLTARHYGITAALSGETSSLQSASSQALTIPELENNLIHQMVSLGGHSLNSLPIGLGAIATPISSTHHGFIGFNPLQQALEISHALPPSSSFTDISSDRVMDE